MKMIRAVVRPEKEEAVALELAKASIPAMTKWDVTGRGKQHGVQIGSQVYDELAKTMLVVVVEDEQVETVIETVNLVARTGYPGDGRIFVTPVESSYTVRTGKPGL